MGVDPRTENQFFFYTNSSILCLISYFLARRNHVYQSDRQQTVSGNG